MDCFSFGCDSCRRNGRTFFAGRARHTLGAGSQEKGAETCSDPQVLSAAPSLKEAEGVSNAKQLLGSVLAASRQQLPESSIWIPKRRSIPEALNLAPLLLAAPHPQGLLAAESARGSGGFEFRWPEGRLPVSGNVVSPSELSGCYDVDWGQPFFRLGIMALSLDGALWTTQ